MKANFKSIIIAIIILVIGIFLGWVFFGNSQTQPIVEHEHVAGDTKIIWTCSMHPQIRQHDPGDCPICGMDLVPLEAEEGEIDPESISMSPTAMQLANVSTAIVGKMRPTKTISLNGKVHEDERLVSSQSSHIEGRIESLSVNFTGEYVTAGQPIAYIYSPELTTTQRELLQAYNIREKQPLLYSAAREKLKNWKLTDKQIDQIIASGDVKGAFPITVDISGYVIQKMVSPGDYVQKGQPIFKIANLSQVWVLFDVYETDMPWINKGDEVSFTVASQPGSTFKGKVSFIDPVINPQTRVAKARVEVNNKELNLKPEMFVSGTLAAQLPLTTEAVVVPKSAVMWTGKRSVVYIKSQTERGVSFAMREVNLGPSLGGGYIIEDGLHEGEEIAVHGTFSIDAAAQLAGKPSMMNPEGNLPKSEQNGLVLEPIKTIHLSHEAKAALKSLLDDYLTLKNALANDDFGGAKKANQMLGEGLSKIDESLFKGESHHVWMQYNKQIEQIIKIASHAEDIAGIRESFLPLSNAMIVLVETFHPNEETIYIQHCPMANSDKGAHWLSQSPEVLNPYYGAAMLTCGAVTKEIK